MITNTPMDAHPQIPSAGKNYEGHFCVLEYRSRLSSINELQVAPVILLVLREGDGKLRFFVHLAWHTMIESEDLDYFQTLLRDFPERAKRQPEELFKHICKLCVGPLVTQQVGSDISNHPSLLELCVRFTELS